MSRRREASHAGVGSWYSDDEERLSLELDRWLGQVPDSVQCIGPLSKEGEKVNFPVSGARVIIVPHAGYSYSGPTAAFAYKALDMSQAKRIFILGPSHHYYLPNCGLSQCQVYETPIGDLTLDAATIAELQSTGLFSKLSKSVDEAEHSVEMQLPYIYKMLVRTFSDYIEQLPPIIPVLVGNTSPNAEQEYGRLFATYLKDPTSVFVVSSDFAHWGARFRYTYYKPSSGPPVSLSTQDGTPRNPPVFESIAAVDMACAGAVESGVHAEFLETLAETGNTVCGRHPIGIIMAALEVLRNEAGADEGKGRFKFVRYERSGDVISARDSSVSYCSAFAVV